MTYPTTSPELTLDFAKTERLDPRVTFSRSSSATYVGHDGLIKTAPDDVARFEYDSDGKCLGLLIEEARTNYCEFSAIDPTNWSENGTASLALSAVSSPDGTACYDLTTDSSGPNSVRLLSSSTPASGKVSLSVYARFPNSGFTALNIRIFSSVNMYADYYPATGTWSGAANCTTIPPQQLGNGWVRLTIVSTNDATGSSHEVRIGGNINGPTFTNETCQVWGAQVEAGTFPTSYIPTSGSTVTRAADLTSITGTNFSSWYNQSEGSLSAQYICNGGTVGNFNIWDGAGNDLNYWSIGVHSQAGGKMSFRTRSSQGTAAGSYFRGRIDRDNNLSEVIKIAAAINTDDFAAFTSSSSGDTNLNTGSSVPAPGGYLPPSVDRFILTNDLAASIHISRLTYYPERVSDESLEAITA